MGTHYGIAQNTKKLNRWAEKTARQLLVLHEQYATRTGLVPYFVLCYTGMSGVAGATALSSALDKALPSYKFGMAYVRKRGENTHSLEDIEFENLRFGTKKNYVPVFVDDFVDMGQTAKRVLKRVVVEMGDMPKDYTWINCFYDHPNLTQSWLKRPTFLMRSVLSQYPNYWKKS